MCGCVGGCHAAKKALQQWKDTPIFVVGKATATAGFQPGYVFVTMYSIHNYTIPSVYTFLSFSLYI